MKLLGGVVSFIAKFKVVWKEWDVRSFIVASFAFQIILILISPFRKRTSSRYVRISTWISYLLADWVAAQAVGLIARATQDSDSAESDLFGLWAQFLLLHLGGPDTITALALQDNELWLRTALHLGTQAYATLGILVRSVRQSTLWIATVLMFVAGFIKYVERATSLHHGRLMDIDDEPYNKYMGELSADGRIAKQQQQQPLSDVAMIRGAFWLFKAYNSVYADLPLKHHVRRTSREYFLKRTPDEAYKIVEIQLNFTYEAMYTKMVIIHKTPWRVVRCVVLSLQAACLVIWCLWDKHGFQGYDVRVTYALLIGAIAVDLLGFLRIQFSDWNVALLKKDSGVRRSRTWLYNKILSTCDSLTCNSSRICSSWKLQNAYLSRKRWSTHICRYVGVSTSDYWLDMVTRCLHFRDSERHSRRPKVSFDREISSKWDFVFEMLTKPCNQLYVLPSSAVKLNMNQMLLRALPIHILDYHNVIRYWFNVTMEHGNHRSRDLDTYIAIAEYLVYLIAFQPNMMYAAAGKGRVVSLQKASFWLNDNKRYNPLEEKEVVALEEEEEDDKDDGDYRRMEKTFGILTLESKGGKDRVRDARRQMKEVKEYVVATKKWEVIPRVWVELLCHAAITCRPNIHAARLKEGGEFLTFVWLLMVFRTGKISLKFSHLRSKEQELIEKHKASREQENCSVEPRITEHRLQSAERSKAVLSS